MKKILIMLVLVLLGLILIFFYQTPIKGLLRDYLPIYTKSYINELSNEKILKFTPKDQAIEAFRSFFILEDNFIFLINFYPDRAQRCKLIGGPLEGPCSSVFRPFLFYGN